MGKQNNSAASTDTHPIEHSRAEAHGFNVIDVTHRDPKYWTGEYVWIDFGGDGRGLTPAQALELADQISKAANAAAARARTAEVAL